MTVVLDSWAIMRLLEGIEPAASRVEEQLLSGEAVINWTNLGEVFYVLCRAEGEPAALRTLRDLESQLKTVFSDRVLHLEAARIKAAHPMSYADAFAAATAVQFGAELWTGDPELMATGRHWVVHDPS